MASAALLAQARKALRDEGYPAAAGLVAASNSLDNAVKKLAMAEAQLFCDDHDLALQTAQEARGLFEKDGKTDMVVETLAKVIVPSYCCKGDAKEAVSASEDALKLAGGKLDLKSTALVASLQAQVLGQAQPSNLEALRDLLRQASEARAAAQTAKDSKAQGRAQLCVSYVQSTRQKFSQAAAAALAALACFREAGDLDGEVESAVAFCPAAEASAAIATAEEVATICIERKEPGHAALVLAALAKANNIMEDVAHIARAYTLADKVAFEVSCLEAPLAAARAMLSKAQVILMSDPDDLKPMDLCETAKLQAKRLKDRRTVAAALSMQARIQGDYLEAYEPALAYARQAVLLYRQMGDEEQEKAMQAFISELFTAAGKAELAPLRGEAEAVLADLKGAVLSKSSVDYENCMSQLSSMSGWQDSDLESAIKPALEKDRPGTVAFLKGRGLQIPGMKDRAEVGVSLYHEDLYLGMRAGGLGYGPYFRLNTAPMGRFYNGHAIEAISTIQLRGFETINEQLDYDDTVIFLPGIHDCMLHTGSALSVPPPTQ